MIGTPHELARKICWRTIHLEHPQECETTRCAAWTFFDGLHDYYQAPQGMRPTGLGWGLVSRSYDGGSIWRRLNADTNRRGFCGALREIEFSPRPDRMNPKALTPEECTTWNLKDSPDA